MCVLQVSADPLKWAPPLKRGGAKMRQHSKLKKKKDFCKFQLTPLKWEPPPKKRGGGGLKPGKIQKKIFIFF